VDNLTVCKIMLDSNDKVVVSEREGKAGGAVVLQDVHALPDVCMDKIRDFGNYQKYVSTVKGVDIYKEEVLSNSTVLTSAQFNVRVSILSFSYFLIMKFKPELNTVTWTMDYQYSSDFDDNVGHWQVMPHPSKEGWSRVLYSCQVKLPNWIPEFVVSFLMKSAAIEATGWVKVESEKAAANGIKGSEYPGISRPDLGPCFVELPDGSASYDKSCSKSFEEGVVTVQDSSTTTPEVTEAEQQEEEQVAEEVVEEQVEETQSEEEQQQVGEEEGQGEQQEEENPEL